MGQTTTATFILPYSSEEPLELNIKDPALAMAVVHRDAICNLEDKWSRAIGVYVLLGPCDDDQYEYRAYVGKSETGGLKERLTTHRNSKTWEKNHGLPKDWWKRALLVRSRAEDGFDSAEAGWLEGRLWEVFDVAPAAKLIGKKGDDQTLPDYRLDMPKRCVPAITAVLRAIGAPPDGITLPNQSKKDKPLRETKQAVTIADLVGSGLLPAEARLYPVPLKYKDAKTDARLLPDGRVRVNGEIYDTLSPAAQAVTKNTAQGGWVFWGVLIDGVLTPLDGLREEYRLASANKPEIQELLVPEAISPPVVPDLGTTSVSSAQADKGKTANEFLSQASPSLLALYEALDVFLLALGIDVFKKETRAYFAYNAQKTKNFACIRVWPQIDEMSVWLKLDPDKVQLEDGFSRDVRGIGHLGSGDLELRVGSAEDLERAKPLLLESYIVKG